MVVLVEIVGFIYFIGCLFYVFRWWWCYLFGLCFLGWSVDSCDNTVISFIWFQGKLFLRSHLLGLHFIYFGLVDCLWFRCGVDATGFYGDDEVTALFQKVGTVDGDDSSLIWLGNICENTVDHWH